MKCTELPSNSVAFQNRNPPQPQQPAGGATNGSQPVVPLAAKPVGFIGRRDEKLVVTPGMLNGGPVELLELENCEVLILDWSNQVVMESCRKCKVLAGPCDGSLMMRSCEEVTLHGRLPAAAMPRVHRLYAEALHVGADYRELEPHQVPSMGRGVPAAYIPFCGREARSDDSKQVGGGA